MHGMKSKGHLQTALAQGMHMRCAQVALCTSTSASMQMWHSLSGRSSSPTITPLPSLLSA